MFVFKCFVAFAVFASSNLLAEFPVKTIVTAEGETVHLNNEGKVDFFQPRQFSIKEGAGLSALKIGHKYAEPGCIEKAFMWERQAERSGRHSAVIGAMVMEMLSKSHPEITSKQLTEIGKDFENAYAQEYLKFKPGYQTPSEKYVDSGFILIKNITMTRFGESFGIDGLKSIGDFVGSKLAMDEAEINGRYRRGLLKANPGIDLTERGPYPNIHIGTSYSAFVHALQNGRFSLAFDEFMGEDAHGVSSRDEVNIWQTRFKIDHQDYLKFEIDAKITTDIKAINGKLNEKLEGKENTKALLLKNSVSVAQEIAEMALTPEQQNRLLLEDIQKQMSDQKDRQAFQDDLRGYQILNNAIASAFPNSAEVQIGTLTASTVIQIITVATSSATAGGKTAGYVGAGVGLAAGIYAILSKTKSAEEIILEEISAVRKQLMEATNLILSAIRRIEMNDNRNFEALYREVNRIHGQLSDQIEETNNAIKQVENNNRNYSELHTVEYRSLDQKIIKLLSHEVRGEEFRCFNGAALSDEYRKTHYLECLDTFYRCAHGEFDSDLIIEQEPALEKLIKERSASKQSILTVSSSLFPEGGHYSQPPDSSRLRNILRVIKLLGGNVEPDAVVHPTFWKFCVDRMVSLAELEPQQYRKFDPEFKRFAEIVGVGMSTERQMIEASNRNNSVRILNAFAEQILAVRNQFEQELNVAPAGVLKNSKLDGLNLWSDWREQAKNIPAATLNPASLLQIGPCETSVTVPETDYLPLLKGMDEKRATEFQAAIWKMVPDIYKILVRNAGGEINFCYQNVFHQIWRVGFGPDVADPKFKDHYGKSSFTLDLRFRAKGSTAPVTVARRIYFIKDEIKFASYLKIGPKPEANHVDYLEKEAKRIEPIEGRNKRVLEIEAELKDYRSPAKMDRYYNFFDYPGNGGLPNPRAEGRNRWESEMRDQMLVFENGTTEQDPVGKIARAQEELNLNSEIKEAKLRRQIAIADNANSGGQSLNTLLQGLTGGKRLIREFIRQFFPSSQTDLQSMRIRTGLIALPDGPHIRADLYSAKPTMLGFDFVDEPISARDRMLMLVARFLEIQLTMFDESPDRTRLVPNRTLREGIDTARNFISSKGALPVLETYLEREEKQRLKPNHEKVEPIWRKTAN